MRETEIFVIMTTELGMDGGCIISTGLSFLPFLELNYEHRPYKMSKF